MSAIKSMKPIIQGGLDSFCGVYSICNAYRITHKATDDEVEMLFEKIVEYLSAKKILKDVLIGGMAHKNMTDILMNICQNCFSEKLSNFKWSEYGLLDWWKFSSDYLENNENSAIILSLAGRENHYTVIERMTEKELMLSDSGGIKKIRRSSCKLQGYMKEDKYVIYPSQCWYLKK